MKLVLPDYLDDIVASGVDVTIVRSEEHGFHIDLNTNAKSHVYLYQLNGKWRAAMRYGEDHPADTIYAVVSLVRDAKDMKGYCNSAWLPLLEKY
jgi:hypothetical protein